MKKIKQTYTMRISKQNIVDENALLNMRESKQNNLKEMSNVISYK